MQLDGKKIVVTGATGGIGSEVCKALAAEGCQLLITGRNPMKLNTLMQSLEGSGHQQLKADLSTVEGRATLLNSAQVFQPDVLINGLGANQLSFLATTHDEDIEAIIQTNLIAPMKLSRDFIPLLAQRPSGAIVNIGSILGSIGYAGSSVYCASKFGLRGFTESLRRELADTQTHVIYFAPRATDTELNSLQIKLMNQALGNAVDQPEQVAARLIQVLKQEKANSCYVGRPESFFVRLNGLFPKLVDKALFKQLPIIRRYANQDV